MNFVPGTFSEGSLRFMEELAADVPADGTVVEIGAYYGRVTRAFARAAAPGVRIFSFQARQPVFDVAGKAIQGDVAHGPVDAYDFNHLAENTRDLENVTVLMERSPPPFDWPVAWAPSLVLMDISSRVDVISENVRFWLPRLAPGGRFVLGSRKFVGRPGGIDTVMAVVQDELGLPMRHRIEHGHFFIVE